MRTLLPGGGISNFPRAIAEVSNVVVTDNMASRGGGIFNQGALVLLESTVSENNADDGGGIYTGGVGIYTEIRRSTVSGNRAGENGGGVFIDRQSISGDDLTVIINSTVSTNHAGRGAPVSIGKLGTERHDCIRWERWRVARARRRRRATIVGRTC